MTEIERKFRVDGVPDQGAGEGTAIEQGYLAIDRGAEVRLRRAGDEHRLTTKSGHGAEREEVEIDLAAADFERLWPLTAGRRIAKTRHRIALGGDLTAEVDVYAGGLAGLRVVEVEFADTAAARGFEPPDWFGAELTGDERYANQALATQGLPAAATSEWDAAP